MIASTWSPDEHASFLTELVAILGSALEYERMLPRVARLAVPLLGDLCAFDLQDPDGSLRRVACAHVDATKEGVAYEARARHGYRTGVPNGVRAVLGTRRSAFVSTVSAADLEQAAQNEDQLAEAVASQVALAGENARLHGEMAVARAGAEAANRAKDQFLSTLSHELR